MEIPLPSTPPQIVVDNTNVQSWQPKPYAEAAVKAGYNVEVIEPDSPWAFDVDELSIKNTHKVPHDVIQEMKDKWEQNITVNDILKSEKE